MTYSSTQPKVELIFDAACPNVPQAREVIKQALQVTGLDGGWQEWEIHDQACPAYARHYGSPTILVDEVDVSPDANNDCACCRIYPENTQFKGCPSVADVIAAIQRD